MQVYSEKRKYPSTKQGISAKLKRVVTNATEFSSKSIEEVVN